MNVTLNQLYKNISHLSYTYILLSYHVVKQCKYLGNLIQSDLRWNLHVNQITVKADQILAIHVEKKY